MRLKPVYQRTIFWGSFFSLIAIVTIYSNWQGKKYRRSILESPAFSAGHFTGLKAEKGKTLIGTYSFTLNDITYIGTEGDARLRDLGKTIYQRSFPVIYNTKDPQKNQILVFPSDFSDYNIPYPDSLRWVQEFD
jgi:hypothetical protein